MSPEPPRADIPNHAMQFELNRLPPPLTSSSQWQTEPVNISAPAPEASNVRTLVTLPAESNLWHPKISPYRLLFISLTISFGTAKAVTSYRNECIYSTTFEWISGVAIFTILFILGNSEYDEYREESYFFDHDLMVSFRNTLRRFSYQFPSYRTDERDTSLVLKSRYPPINGYSILWTASTVSFGLIKAVLAYLGFSTAPNVLDWVFGVALTTGFYYLGLYEYSAVNVMRSLFEEDYTPIIQDILGSTLKRAPPVVLHIVVFILSANWAYLWYGGIIELWDPVSPGSWRQGSGSKEGVSEMSPFFNWIFILFCTILAASLGVGAGIFMCCVVVLSSCRSAFPYVKRAMEKLKEKLRSNGIEWEGWLGASFIAGLLDTFRHPSGSLQNIYKKILYLLAIVGYISVHVFGLFIASGWSVIWGHTALDIVTSVYREGITVGGYFSIMAFCLGAFMATIFGVVGAIVILVSLAGPIFGKNLFYSLFS